MNEQKCKKCGATCEHHVEIKATGFCDYCAQTILAKMKTMMPVPPKAITWEIGNAILDALQDEFYRLNANPPNAPHELPATKTL